MQFNFKWEKTDFQIKIKNKIILILTCHFCNQDKMLKSNFGHRFQSHYSFTNTDAQIPKIYFFQTQNKFVFSNIAMPLAANSQPSVLSSH